MQSNNPILTRVETYNDATEAMSIQGAIQKSVLLTVIAAVVGIALFFYCAMTANLSIAYAAAIVGAIGGLILALIATFKTKTAPALAIPYALFEGAFLGGISFIFQLKFPGVPLQALSISTIICSNKALELGVLAVLCGANLYCLECTAAVRILFNAVVAACAVLAWLKAL